ncbi:MAG: tetratricopeptide repeat protein [Xanthomonadales bacterium]|nr:tetratricopeptide repeat protein [Xanthomonadales bacterium]
MRPIELLPAALTFALLLSPAAALERVDHPDPDAFRGTVAEIIREAQAELDAKEQPSGEDYGRLAMVYQAHEQFIPAQQAYRNAAELAPADARWPYFLGILARADGEFEQAIEQFQASLEHNPDYVPARIRLARALIDAGRTQRAEHLLQDLVGEYPDVAAIHADLGLLAAQGGDHAAAVEHFERALELQPQATQLHYPLGLSYRALGDTDLARTHLTQRGPQEVVFPDPLYQRMRGLSGSYAYYISLGLSAARNKDFQAALQLMRQAVEANPESPEARINYARMLEANGNIAGGIAELLKVIEAHPDNALAHFNMGAMFELDGNDETARYYYQQAVEHQPQMFEARLLLANNLMRADLFNEAARQYAAAFQLRPGRSELLLRQAIAEHESGRCGQALGTLLNLVERLPENFEALTAYSRVAATCPEADDRARANALNAARNMYALSPQLAVVQTVAMTEAAHGNFDAAVDFQSQAMFMAVRDGLTELVERMKPTLEAYRAGRPAAEPWGEEQPLLDPPRLTPEDRQ